MKHSSRLAAYALLIASATVGAFGPRAAGQERTFAGSVQSGYLFATDGREGTGRIGLDGFTTELSLKVAADVSEHVSAQAKVCFSCHGFELGMAFVDFRVHDALAIRVGRFNPSFGEFALRHDPANHATMDKPLPYDMGRMLRLREWNMSVLPVPYVDNGVELSGTHWFGDNAQLDWAAYAVGGLRGGADDVDVDFVQMRSSALYYLDNNRVPAVGGRVALTALIGDFTLTTGVSGMWGHYDPDAERSYAIVGADFYARLGIFTLRGEYLIRRTEMALGENPGQRFAYGPGSDGRYDDFFLKEGFYVTSELDVHSRLKLVARVDGMRRIGNVRLGDALRSRSAILRYTAGMNVFPHRSVRVKLFAQFYDFSDFDDAVAGQVAVSASF